MPVFLPDLILPALTDLTDEMLLQRGVKLLMLDFDNTIVPYTTDTPTDAILDWIRTMQTSPIRVCVVSNTKKPRVRSFCQTYGLDYIMRAGKPFHRGIRQCLTRYSLAPQQAALVGDQIFTDVLGANTAGLTAVLISAIDNHTVFLKARHAAELPFIALGRIRLRRLAEKRQKSDGSTQKN